MIIALERLRDKLAFIINSYAEIKRAPPRLDKRSRVGFMQEDELLREIVELELQNNKKPEWKNVATNLDAKNPTQFPRNPKQCRERYSLSEVGGTMLWTPMSLARTTGD